MENKESRANLLAKRNILVQKYNRYKIDQTEQLSSTTIRNRLAEEYNRLIREGDPETNELREQIHDQIQKLEKTDA